MAQLLASLPLRLHRHVLSETLDTAAEAHRRSPRGAPQPRRPHFVFSPGLVKYFAALHGQQAAVEGRDAIDE